MGFFDTLRRTLGGGVDAPTGFKQPPAALRSAWGLDEPPPIPPLATNSHEYDRAQWQKKMKKILDELPDSKSQWADLLSDARALNLDPDWLTRAQVDEFLLLIRRAVSDRLVTEDEHEKIELARKLIGIPEPEAEAALQTVLAEAEAFFGKPVEEE